MIRFLIDTNIASYFLKRKFPSLHERMKAAMLAGEVAISTVTRAELRYGQALMPADDRRRRLIDAFLEEIPTLDWTAAAADHYGRLAAIQKQTGTPIGTLDTQIAAHAVAEHLVLITHNTRHFERVPDLQMETWVS
ncbi:MAG: type II toxin-antitoxin system VapC family toxin [Zoogloeaceae bacterium]|nr:type II toxin-antitoxin system VapC family toxin [Zoogloeaceae bacterium]